MAFSLNDFKPFIDWMQANPGFSAFAVFIISCAESLAIIGLFIPGTIVMPAIGSMIGAGVLPAHWVIVAAILGAILGDNLSYWLGYHFHQHIRQVWPFKHFPKLLTNGENFFKHYGGLSVFIGRFVGPVRPIIPVVAGMLNMLPLRFFIANVTSAIAWAILYMAPGILLGIISEQLAPHVAARLLVILAIFTFAAWVLFWLLNKIWNHLHLIIERLSTRWWLYLIERYSMANYFIHFERSNNPKPLAIFLYLIALVILLLLTSLSVFHNGMITFLNWPVFFFFRSIQIPPLDTLMAYAFNITNSLTLISISFSIFAWLLFQKTWRASVFWLANILFTLALAVTLQYMMKISPPDAHTLFYSTYSYPSIYLAVFITLVGSFVMFTYYDLIWLRHKKYIVAIMAFIIAIAAVPLLYLGFNWLSDCIASFCCGAISTWTCILFFHRKIQRLNIRPMLFIATIALIISTFISGIEETPALLEKLSQPDFRLSYPLTQWWGNNEPPASITRTNFLGNESELLAIQYAGNINALVQALQKTGWGNAPKASLTVILNRIGAKDRSQELPLFPDLYQAEKPLLVMTKKIDNTNEFLILRIWPSQVLLQPNNLPLWFGTIKFHRTWHWKTLPNTAEENELSPLLILQQDLSSFSRILTETDKPLCKALVCQKFILKIINNKTRPPDDNYY